VHDALLDAQQPGIEKPMKIGTEEDAVGRLVLAGAPGRAGQARGVERLATADGEASRHAGQPRPETPSAMGWPAPLRSIISRRPRPQEEIAFMKGRSGTSSSVTLSGVKM
jgi:hypothetical protein